jgi:hypothetical protein
VVIITHVNASATGGTFEFCIVRYRTQCEKVGFRAEIAKNFALEYQTIIDLCAHVLSHHSARQFLLDVWFEEQRTFSFWPDRKARGKPP